MSFAKKSLGQNFLISPRIVGAIASAGDLHKDDVVIEIGPGKGVLTEALLSTGARVYAIEKDDRLIPVLTDKFKAQMSSESFELIHGDVLELPTEVSTRLLFGSYKVIANIPYYITGQIVRMFLSAQNKPSMMVLMVQKEVASRIIARDGKESILSLSVKAYAKPELVMNVSRGNFFPAPNVDSAVIKLSDIHSPFANEAEEARFFDVVKAGFAQKRKRLAKNLEAVADGRAIEAAFNDAGIDKNARAEDVPLGTWLLLSRKL